MKVLGVAIAGVVSWLAVPVTPAHAGCKLTLRANQPEPRGGGDNHFCIDWTESEVKIKGGLWKSLQKAVEKAKGQPTDFTCLNKSESFSFVIELDFGCSVGRQYRFKLRRVSDQHTMMDYVPSATDYTKESIIDLGDLRQYF